MAGVQAAAVPATATGAVSGAVSGGAPVDPERSGAGGAAAPLVTDSDDVSSRRVVFVDDEPANCRLGLRMLAKLGIGKAQVTTLANGRWRPLASGLVVVGWVGDGVG